MREGLLHFDNTDPARRSLKAKIERAAGFYQAKYSQRPTLCFVHPTAALGAGDDYQPEGIEVRFTNSVLPNHFWLGVEVDERAQVAPRTRSRTDEPGYDATKAAAE